MVKSRRRKSRKASKSYRRKSRKASKSYRRKSRKASKSRRKSLPRKYKGSCKYGRKKNGYCKKKPSKKYRSRRKSKYKSKSRRKLKVKKSHFYKGSRLPCDDDHKNNIKRNCKVNDYTVRSEPSCLGCEDEVITLDDIEKNPVCVNGRCYDADTLKKSVSNIGAFDPISKEPLQDPDNLLAPGGQIYAKAIKYAQTKWKNIEVPRWESKAELGKSVFRDIKFHLFPQIINFLNSKDKPFTIWEANLAIDIYMYWFDRTKNTIPALGLTLRDIKNWISTGNRAYLMGLDTDMQQEYIDRYNEQNN